MLVAQNLVDTFSNVKDDGAGIYTYNPGTTASNRIIRKNIVLNAIGAFAGAEGHYWEAYGKAAGIYLDDRSYNTLVDGNTLANGNWGGIFLHNCGNNQITNNFVYNFRQQMLFGVESGKINRNFKVNGNIFVAKNAFQKTVQIDFSINDKPNLMGLFDENVYARPINDSHTFSIKRTYVGGGDESLSLAKWKSDYKQDLNSSKSKVSTTSENNLSFYYNYTDAEVTIPLNSLYSDVTGKKYTSNIKLKAYGGIVLIKMPSDYIVQSIKSGNWADSLVWSGGQVPGSNDSVKINKGHIIKVQQDISIRGLQVSTGGELLFLGDYKVNN
ncbi:DUF1565 domain-containing protein [Dyadobacter sp. NIV53]|uniref:DUF1565 domain-containing protein n=1 Tax=Dyadobacter sp. NIV53 TaxID=2861765 RepID=UPI0038D3A635